jgi:hypothetical protein
MIAPLTPNAQAILLLTAPLLAGRSEGSPDLLTLTEYNRLARILRGKQKQPADLIGPNAEETVRVCAGLFGRERLESLLGRGFLLGQAVDRWNSRAIWVVSRADATYPRRLKAPGESMAGEAGRGRRAGEAGQAGGALPLGENRGSFAVMRATFDQLNFEDATDGELQFTLPDVLKVPPISQHGNVNEIIGTFGGADQLRNAVNQLQTLLDAA